MNPRSGRWVLLVSLFAPACAGATVSVPPPPPDVPPPPVAEAPKPLPESAAPGTNRWEEQPTPASRPAQVWTKIGERQPDGGRDRDTFWVTGPDNVFRVLSIRVARDRIRVDGIIVEFEDGTTWSPKVPLLFRAGDNMILDMPGRARRVRAVHLQYSDLSRGRETPHVTVWGR